MRKRLSLAPAILLFLAARRAPAAAPELKYTVLLMGNRAGSAATSAPAKDERVYTFEFNDRGRGPRLETRVRLGAGSRPVSISTSGNDYYKGPVDDRFTLEADRARWKNTGEQGESRPAGPAFFVSFNAAPQELALLADALLASPGHKLALLPVGEAELRPLGEAAAEAGGKRRNVRGYEIRGLDFTPMPVWLDPDGELFAWVSPWTTVIREGWEGAVDQLQKAQDAEAGKRAEDLARKLARRPAGALAFRNAALFDSRTASVRPGTTVVVEGDRIRSVGPDGQVPVPPGAEVIDAAGKTLLPGLWDMHVHLGDNDGVLHLAAGVTTVRDLANDTDRLLALRRKFDEGTVLGPRVLMAGFLDGRGPYSGPTKVFADSVEEAKTAIDNYAKLGYVQIKIYSSIKPELVAPIARMAHEHGLRVSGHVPAFMTAEQFVRDGSDEIQHINFLFLNFLFDAVKDTRTPARFTAVAEHAAELDLGSPRVTDFVNLLREHGTVVDPTVSVFEGLFTDRPGTISNCYAAVADRLPPQIRRGFLAGGLPVPEGKDQRYRDSFEALLRMVALLDRSGIPIVAGTDGLAGFTLHRELELYARAGIPAPRVLQIATLGAARVMKRDAELGSIEPGKLADLLLVGGDPASHISDIRRVETVVKGGVVYRAADLDRAIGVRP